MRRDIQRRRFGRLKHGNPSGDFNSAPRCGARTRQGTACRCPAIRGRQRCRLHGGKSTGPRTLAGLARIRKANTRHGRWSQETVALAREIRRSQAETRQNAADLADLPRETREEIIRHCSALTPRHVKALRKQVRERLDRGRRQRLEKLRRQ